MDDDILEEKVDYHTDKSGRKWRKITRARKSGASVNTLDVYVIPPCGSMRLRSTKELTVYLREKSWYE